MPGRSGSRPTASLAGATGRSSDSRKPASREYATRAAAAPASSWDCSSAGSGPSAVLAPAASFAKKPSSAACLVACSITIDTWRAAATLPSCIAERSDSM